MCIFIKPKTAVRVVEEIKVHQCDLRKESI